MTKISIHIFFVYICIHKNLFKMLWSEQNFITISSRFSYFALYTRSNSHKYSPVNNLVL